MPTPISTVNDRAAIHLSANTMVMWPELAKYPMLVITEWSYIDHYLGTLLADMMHAGIPEALAIYQSIWSPDGRRKALTNVAETALAADGFSLFRAVMHGLTPSRDDRHRFAHHLWGYSPDLPDALLLAPSRLGSFKIHYREEPTKTGIITETDRQQVWCGRQQISSKRQRLPRRPTRTSAVSRKRWTLNMSWLHGAVRGCWPTRLSTPHTPSSRNSPFPHSYCHWAAGFTRRHCLSGYGALSTRACGKLTSGLA
jgi:hypothetical protein